jgi:TRAP-type C4-dicarboxylate transport system permease large subunit
VQFERESGTVLSMGLAVWMVQSIVPLGFALMALRFALRMLEALAQLRKHLSIIFLTNLEIGYSTPPVGLNLFLGSLRFERSITQLYRASWPFLIVLGLALLSITYVSELSLVLVRWFGYADLPVLTR